jgi:hypothetical protein
MTLKRESKFSKSRGMFDGLKFVISVRDLSGHNDTGKDDLWDYNRSCLNFIL